MYFLWQKVILHILLLKKALKYGLILKKAHRTILFKQKNGFSNMIVKVLIAAKNDFDKNLDKLLSNSLFDETI